MIRHLTFALSLSLLPTVALAQSAVGGGFDSYHPIWEVEGDSSRLGEELVALRDVNGDAIPDILVGRQARILSGRNGGLIRQLDQPPNGAVSGFGQSVAAVGDVDGDLVEDVLVGAPLSDPSGPGTNEGSALLFSGATGALLHRFDGVQPNDQLGNEVAGIGDIDGDTIPDVAVAASHASPSGLAQAGSVFLFSGASGSQLHRIDGQVAGDEFGIVLVGPGDLTGDGTDDIVVGTASAEVSGVGRAGAVYMFSGASRTLVWRVDGLQVDDYFGRSVSAVGDVDGDGVRDLVVGASGADSRGLVDSGAIFILSGTSGTVIRRIDGEQAGDRLGSVVAGLGDVDGDGRPDLGAGLLTAPRSGGTSGPGQVVVFSAVDGKLLDVIDGQSDGDVFGSALARLGDVNNDGIDDIAIGAPNADSPQSSNVGRVSVFGWRQFLTATSATVSGASGGILGYQIDFRGDDANEPYILLMSFSGTGPFSFGGLDIPLTLDPIVITTFFGNIGSPILQAGFRGTLNANGDAVAYLGFPAGLLSPFVGFRFHLAAICGPVGMLPDTASRAVELRIVP